MCQRIDDVIKEMKKSYEEVITHPNKDTNSYIKSQRLIKKLHDFISNELISNGVEKDQVKAELKLYGAIKFKDQDICVIPDNYERNKQNTEISWGECAGTGKKCASDDITEKILSINIRSQFSSLMKNKDTLIERTFAEALNFHLRCNNMCLGEVYLLPIYEYDNSEFKNNTVKFKKTLQYKLKLFKDLNREDIKKLINIKYKTINGRKEFIEKLKEYKVETPLIYKLYEEEQSVLEKYKGKKLTKKMVSYIETENDYNRLIEIRKILPEKIRELRNDIKTAISIRSRIEMYIKFFDTINMRTDVKTDYHKYERCALILVDFSESEPILYSTTESLKDNGLVDSNFDIDLKQLNIDDFIPDLLGVYKSRFKKRRKGYNLIFYKKNRSNKYNLRIYKII